MSLHKFAEQVAANGRGEDSLLVHMTPDEVRKLQQFAEANGTTLTINPDTGLPEAGMLSDLFKAIAPIALGAFLGPAGMGLQFGGLSSAMSAGIATGGITALATGSLSRGLMAGMGAYGGAGLGESLMGIGGNALVAGGAPIGAENVAGAAVPPIEQINPSNFNLSAADKFGAGAKAVTASPGAALDFAKNNLGYLTAAASPIMAGAMVPTTTKMPTAGQDPGYIRQQVFDPISQTYRSLTPVKANEWKDRSFSDIYRGYAGGGIVALAGGGMPGYAGNEGSLVNDEQVFNYFKGLDQSKLNSGALDAQIAADMQKYKVNPEDIARITGTQDRLADYQTRFAAQPPVATTGGLDTLAANQVQAPVAQASTPISTNIAAIQGTPIIGATAGTTGGLDSLAANQTVANQTATADANAAAKLGVFQTVYDPKTGREFNSPAQALQFGVTNYVTSLPSSIALPPTAQNAVNAWLARPENKGKTANDALNSLGAQFGMTGDQFKNAEIQGSIGYGDQQVTRSAIGTESGGLTPEQLTAKLQAYKTKPPTTAQEFADQRALYADYQNRYANSSYNYANMGGKAQDHTLKPSDYLAVKFSGYAEPINAALSSMNQMSTDFKDMSKILQANPEINTVVDELYKINPKLQLFNTFSPTTVANLNNDIKRYGSTDAMRRLIDQQQNLLVTSPDAQGKLGNFNQTTMANPDYRALNAIKDSYTPIADDAAWNKSVNALKASKGETIGTTYRDAETGKGLAIQTNDATGQLAAIRFIDQAGQVKTVYGGPEDLFTAAYESGIPFSAFSEMAKKLGTEYLIPPPKPEEKQYFLPALQNGVKFSDFADGTAAKVLASDSYLKDVQNRALADYQWSIKNGTPENAAGMALQSAIDKAVNNQKIAKASLGDQGGGTTASTASAQGAPAGLAALAANQTATTDTQTAPTGVAALAANQTTAAQAPPNTGAAAYAAANNVNLSKNIADWVAAHPNATDAQVDAEMAKYGVTGEDVAKALPQYGGSKGLSWALNQGNMGLAGLNKNILDYVATHGNTAADRTVAENTLAKYGLNAADVKRATGKTLDELFAAKKVVTDGDTVVTDDGKVVTDDGKVTKVDTGTKVITNDDGTKVTRVTTPTDITTAPDVTLPPGIGGNTGPSIFGGGTTVNPNGTITTSPRIPGIPVGGFPGMKSLRDAYTQGGGSLGYTPYTPKTAAEHATMYNTMTGDSAAAYKYLMGEGAYPTKSGVGEIAKPYRESVMGYPASTNKAYNYVNGQYVRNPDYVAPMRDSSGNVTYGMSLNEIKSTLAKAPLSGQALYDWAMQNEVTAQDIADATGMKLSEVYAQLRIGQQAAAAKAAADKAAGVSTGVASDGGGDDGGAAAAAAAASAADSAAAAAASATGNAPGSDGTPGSGAKRGGLMPMNYAVGGGLGSLGSYSDGGRLLRGPGDGVSDSIPATIGAKGQPARLADGEFVVPARIVSELGNGSTEAGAKKLYAMMDRVQRARGKTTGKNKVAANSRADKYLPA